MKKSFLLLIAGLGVLSASAQMVNTSAVHVRTSPNADATSKRPLVLTNREAGAHKTTTMGGNDWFFYNVACANAGTGVTAALIGQYPDSNIYYPSGTPSPFYIWSHGIGVSFDPTSPYFSWAWSNTTFTAPTIVVTNGSSYTVDSVNLAGLYQRNVTTGNPDTLYIDLTYADTTGTYLVTYKSSQLVSYGIIQTPVNPWDTTWTMANAYYNWMTNSIDGANTTPVWRFTKILDAAAEIDTTSSGLNEWSFPRTGSPAVTISGTAAWPMVVPAGNKVVAYAHFASSHAFPLGTANTAANLWLAYGEDFGITPLQTYPGDMNVGLNSTTGDKYHITGDYNFVNLTGGGTAPILEPTYFYTAPIGVHNPWFGFHLSCSGCFNTEVANSNLITGVKATPNPAGNSVTISYTVTQNASGTATLTNVAGQVVATQKAANGRADFNVATLANGVYFYTLEINGQRSTGRVVVAH